MCDTQAFCGHMQRAYIRSARTVSADILRVWSFFFAGVVVAVSASSSPSSPPSSWARLWVSLRWNCAKRTDDSHAIFFCCCLFHLYVNKTRHIGIRYVQNIRLAFMVVLVQFSHYSFAFPIQSIYIYIYICVRMLNGSSAHSRSSTRQEWDFAAECLDWICD